MLLNWSLKPIFPIALCCRVVLSVNLFSYISWDLITGGIRLITFRAEQGLLSVSGSGFGSTV